MADKDWWQDGTPVTFAPAPQIRYPCGCVTCICEDEEQCSGYGAKACRSYGLPECQSKTVVDIGCLRAELEQVRAEAERLQAEVKRLLGTCRRLEAEKECARNLVATIDGKEYLFEECACEAMIARDRVQTAETALQKIAKHRTSGELGLPSGMEEYDEMIWTARAVLPPPDKEPKSGE